MAKKNKNFFDLQPRHVAAMDHIFQRRHLNLGQVVTLLPSSESQYRPINPRGQFRQGREAWRKHLRKLKQAGFLKEIERPIGETLYAINYQRDERTKEDPPGAKVLYDSLGYERQEVISELKAIRDYLNSDSTYKYLHLKHKEEINDTYACLVAALRDHPNASWAGLANGDIWWFDRRPQETMITVWIPNEDIPDFVRPYLSAHGDYKSKLSRIPDALFRLRADKNHDSSILFVYEHDRGSMSLDRVAAKLYCYLVWNNSKGYKELADQLRVLIVTKSRTRLQNMIKMTAFQFSERGSRLFWFTTKDHFSLERPASILEPMWTVAHQDHLSERHSIIERTIESPK